MKLTIKNKRKKIELEEKQVWKDIKNDLNVIVIRERNNKFRLMNLDTFTYFKDYYAEDYLRGNVGNSKYEYVGRAYKIKIDANK